MLEQVKQRPTVAIIGAGPAAAKVALAMMASQKVNVNLVLQTRLDSTYLQETLAATRKAPSHFILMQANQLEPLTTPTYHG